MAMNKAPHIVDKAELRRLAEEQLGENIKTEPRAVDETQRVLHELQVHQVELEMQNEELCQARAEMETLLEKYTDLYEFAPVGYFTLDRKGTILAVNLTGAGLLGIVRSRLKSRHFGNFVAGTARPAFSDFLGMIFTGLAKGTCEIPLLKDGASQLIVQIEAVVVASGQECHIALIDITKRKQAEEALQRVEEEAVEALQKVTIAADEALRVMKESEIEPEAAQLKVLVAVEKARLKVAEAAEEARLKVAEAAEKAYLTIEQPESLQKLKVATDVARLKVAEAAVEACAKVAKAAVDRQLIETANELRVAEAATTSKSQFLANMSHELRTPMTGVLGMLDLVLLGNLEAEQREYIEISKKSGLSLVRILNDILDLTKIEAGKLSIEEKPFSVRECVENTCNIFFPLVRGKGIDLDCAVANDVPGILIGDLARICQVVTNLVGNAVKFTQKGKVELRVTAGASTLGGKREVTFAVSDSGTGIPDDKKHLLFHAFSQVDDSHSRSYGGTGLGLTISKEIGELMGGTITFASEERVGSVFTFTLPLAEAQREREAQLATNPQPTDSKSATSEGERIPRILLVDDEPTIGMILGAMLKKSRYEMDLAEDGQKAIEMWELGGYDLVLMDVQMPRLNGFEATSIIRCREQERGSHTPIIAMTAHAGNEAKEKCLAAGMDDYIAKPIDFEKTLQVIGETLKNFSRNQ